MLDVVVVVMVLYIISFIITVILIYKDHKPANKKLKLCDTCDNLIQDCPGEQRRYVCKRFGSFRCAPKYCAKYMKRKEEKFDNEEQV